MVLLDGDSGPGTTPGLSPRQPSADSGSFERRRILPGKTPIYGGASSAQSRRPPPTDRLLLINVPSVAGLTTITNPWRRLVVMLRLAGVWPAFKTSTFSG
jgi:hypothetical protein